MQYYIYVSDNKIVGCSNRANDGTCIEVTQDVYQDYIKYPDKYVYQDGEIVENENFENTIIALREEEFKSNFIEVSDGLWFRKIPKGYSSAVEAMNAAFNIVSITGTVPAHTLIFYTEPDYTNEEQCTEEWLANNQTYNEELSATEFGAMYATFITNWNTSEHQS